MEELVARCSASSRGRRDRAEDAAALAAAELVEHGRDLRLRARPSSRRGRRRSGRSSSCAADEEAEAVGGDVLLGGREPAERVEEVVLDDPRAPPSASSRASVSVVLTARDRRRARAARARAGGTAPRRGRLRRSRRRDGSRAPARAPAAAAVEHRLDERGLDARTAARRRQATVPRGDRPLDRLARRLAVEVVDAHVVREQRAGRALRSGRASPTRPRGSRAGRCTGRFGSLTTSAQLGREPASAVAVPSSGWYWKYSSNWSRTTSSVRPRAPPGADVSASVAWRRRQAPRRRALLRAHARLASLSTPCIGSSRHERNDADGERTLAGADARAASRRPWTTPAMQQRALADAARPVEDRQPRRRAGSRRRSPTSVERPKKKPASPSP